MSKKKTTAHDSIEETPTVVLPTTTDSSTDADATSVLPATDGLADDHVDPTKVLPTVEQATAPEAAQDTAPKAAPEAVDQPPVDTPEAASAPVTPAADAGDPQDFAGKQASPGAQAFPGGQPFPGAQAFPGAQGTTAHAYPHSSPAQAGVPGQPAGSANMGVGQIPEAPFNSVRIGLLIWAVIVAIVGLLMICSAFFNGISFGVLLTSLIGGCGVILILGAAISALRARS